MLLGQFDRVRLRRCHGRWRWRWTVRASKPPTFSPLSVRRRSHSIQQICGRQNPLTIWAQARYRWRWSSESESETEAEMEQMMTAQSQLLIRVGRENIPLPESASDIDSRSFIYGLNMSFSAFSLFSLAQNLRCTVKMRTRYFIAATREFRKSRHYRLSSKMTS
jgi:hypothetical protein